MAALVTVIVALPTPLPVTVTVVPDTDTVATPVLLELTPSVPPLKFDVTLNVIVPPYTVLPDVDDSDTAPAVVPTDTVYVAVLDL